MMPRPEVAPAAIATNGLALRARPFASTAAANLSAGRSVNINTNNNRREVEPLQASAMGPVQTAAPSWSCFAPGSRTPFEKSRSINTDKRFVTI